MTHLAFDQQQGLLLSQQACCHRYGGVDGVVAVAGNMQVISDMYVYI